MSYLLCNKIIELKSSNNVENIYCMWGVLHQIFGAWVQHAKTTWTQSDIRFCENEGSNRFKINEKGGHLDRKYRRKFIQNA